MKTLYRFILMIIISFPANILAQDWQCVHEGVTATFVDTTHLDQNYTANSMWVVHIDSVRVYQGWNYHYGFKKPRLVSLTYSGGEDNYCFDPHAPSRMGVAMSALGGENFFFNSAGLGIRISTLRSPDQPWICCGLSDTSLLYATVTSMDVETILGEPDSVKYISFQAKSNAGALLPHPMNSQVFLLSKHFGMITLFDFYQFPKYTSNNPVHLLTGMKAPGTQSGDQNLTYKEVYSFAPGDEFHTIESGTHPNVPVPETLYVFRILDSIWNTNKDTVTYRISRNSRYWYYQPTYIQTYTYRKDTILISYAIYSNNCFGIDNLPEQTIFCNDTNGILKSANSFEQLRSSDYNSRWTKFASCGYNPCLFCADTLVGTHSAPLSCTNLYISGCGGPYYYRGYYDWFSHKTSSAFYKLKYFKKGSETWGTPFYTTGWEDPNIIKDTLQDTVPVRFILYPNPSNNFITVEIPDSSCTGYRLEVYSMLGIKVNEIMLTDTKITFDISNYGAGIYFMKLFKNNLQVGQEKLIKN